MKRIWMIVSTMAIANMIAVVALLGWLQSSGRLNRDRVQSIRTMLSTTIAMEQQAAAEQQAKAAAEQAKVAEEAKAAVPPETAAEKIAADQLAAEKQLQSVLRQKQELQNLRDGLMRQLADLEQRERALALQRTAFEAERRRIAESEGQAQFKTALSTLENQKAKDAKLVLAAMLDGGEVDQVVAYLSKMDESKRSKVMAEFVKDAPKVAADLLERLRTRGLEVPRSAAAGSSTDATSVASNADSAGAAAP